MARKSRSKGARAPGPRAKGKPSGDWTPQRRAKRAADMKSVAAKALAARNATYAKRGVFVDFAARALTIRTKAGALDTLKLNRVQEVLHLMAERQITHTGKVRMLVLKARQPGVSTYVEARLFWKALIGRGLRAFILTHEEPASNNLFAMAKRFYEHYGTIEPPPEDGKEREPLPTLPELVAANARELKFAGIDCSYRVGTAGTEGIGRSETVQLFHGSEVAHWPNAESHAAGVLQAVPDAEGTEIWLESTAFGPAGLFHSMCLRAQEGVGDYELAFFPWFVHGEYKDKAPFGWQPPDEWRIYGEQHLPEKGRLAKLYWAWRKNAELANAMGASTDEPCWRFRQEYPATVEDAFRTSGDDSYLRAELVEAAMANAFPEERGAPLILGVDVAAGGADKTHIVDRRGRRLGHVVNLSIDDGDQMAIAGRLARVIQIHRPAMVFVDTTGGYGAGVVDRLREQGFTMVRGINFGTRAAQPEHYLNKRAEMWAKLKEWLEEGADVVADPVLRRHLTAPNRKWGSNGKLQLESKEDIRKRLGLSPDRADAAALTFAEPVRAQGPVFMPEAAQSGYDMFR